MSTCEKIKEKKTKKKKEHTHSHFQSTTLAQTSPYKGFIPSGGALIRRQLVATRNNFASVSVQQEANLQSGLRNEEPAFEAPTPPSVIRSGWWTDHNQQPQQQGTTPLPVRQAAALSDHTSIRSMRRTSLGRFPRNALAQQFWAPFASGDVSGYDLTKYKFSEGLRSLVHEPVFTCQVNGYVGNMATLEDFFVVLLCGFDIQRVRIVDAQQCGSPMEAPYVASGTFQAIHTRSLLGWKPANHSDINVAPLTVEVPFHMRGEFCVDQHEPKLNHLTFKAPLIQMLREKHHADVPANILDTLENADAVKMLVTLRRARVKPEIITDRALRSASKKQDTWSSALGLW